MENQQNKTCEAALGALREQIDQIDNQMISLITQRMEMIAKVGELKKNNHEKFFIKSSREADMVKALAKKVAVNFPKLAIVNIWRKIITSANMNEQPIRIAIHNPKNIPDYAYLVKDYYSDAVPLHISDSATTVISELEKNDVQIGVFALPQSDHDENKQAAQENWWIALANNRLGLRVFAKIPFVEFSDEDKNRNQIKLVAVAIKQPEKSSEDNSLIYVEANKEISKSQILAALKEFNLQGKILKSVNLHQVDGLVFYLIELEGFYVESDEAIKNFAASKIKPYVKILGHYATPIMV
jgi:chorismate mutase